MVAQRILKRYRRYAAGYDLRWAAYNAAVHERASRAILRNGDAARVLDVACGTGLLAEMLKRDRPDLRITGVDPSADMLKRARRRFAHDKSGSLEWLAGSAESLPVASEMYDVLTCTSAFHMIPDAGVALTEFNRALKPGGRLVIVDWSRDFLSMKLLTAMQSLWDRSRHVRTVEELASLIERAGFVVEKSERFRGPHLWGLMCIVARKP